MSQKTPSNISHNLPTQSQFIGRSDEEQNLQKFLTTEPFLNTPFSPIFDPSSLSDLGEVEVISEVSSPNEHRDFPIYEIIFTSGLKFRGSIKEKIVSLEEAKGANITPVGVGQFELSNGDLFVGKIETRTEGEITYADTTHYKGQFYKFQKSGKGVETYPDGSKYFGMFKQNKKSGKGRIEYQNGDIYKGTFKAEKRNGIGTYLIMSGGKFIGDWKDDHLEGKGKWVVGNGSEIPGSFMKSQVKL